MRDYLAALAPRGRRRGFFAVDIYPAAQLWLNGGLIDLRNKRHDSILALPAGAGGYPRPCLARQL
ncbi:hypothetical protein KOSB73_240146 [Klebsiella grimontii]|uniref:Uncharacterized protein n=1 Tax=Klebsiella grimontii TaxID=2058152 RepID=A0A285B1Z8_9ENTR|nr:hypothetical protein KOSB73_240146 [Klebsiella grimontii]